MRCWRRPIAATTRPSWLLRLRALDRVLRHGHYFVPQWYSGKFRIAYRSGRFVQPEVTPRYYQPEAWVIDTWWAADAQQTAKR